MDGEKKKKNFCNIRSKFLYDKSGQKESDNSEQKNM